MEVEVLPNESEEYRTARLRLLEAERNLREERMRVAALRRELPVDTVVEDYVFDEGPADLLVGGPITQVRLSELFTDRERPLILYHLMYGGAQENPCPMCSMWIDGWNGVARHLQQNVNLAVVAQAPIEDIRTYARHRGWDSLRFLSSAGSSFKSDFKTQNDDGRQDPAISVFALADDGSSRHFYSGDPFLGQGSEGGLDLLSPVWNALDLTPQGRGDWYPSREYA